MTTDTSWADVAAATAALLETAYGMREGDQAADSLCAGWTRGHVLTHVARNADAIGNLVTWAVTGVPTPMYASAEAREADIEAGAARPVADLVADVEASAARLAGQTADLAPAHDAVEIELRGGWRIRASELAWRRLREVAYHHVDLDAGFGFADLPPDLTSAFLADEVAGLRRHPQAPALTLHTTTGEEFTVGAGTAYVTGTPAALLGWLARGLTEGLATDGALPHLRKGPEMSRYAGHVTSGGASDVRELRELIIRKCSVGEYDNNAYLLTCRTTGEQLLVDAAADAPRLRAFVAEGTGNLGGIVTTHRHGDHVRALAEIAAWSGAPTAAGAEDAAALPLAPDRALVHGDVLRVGAVALDVVHLRGHTEGGVALAYADPAGFTHLITGDSLFPGGVGNTKMPGQSFEQLYADVTARIFDVYGDDTWVYPGHGDDTTLRVERPYLAEWLARGW